MSEDDNLIYDFEADWKPCNSGKDKKIFFENQKLTSLFRIIDMDKQTVTFSDVERIIKITDINKVLVKEDSPKNNFMLYGPIANRVLDEIRPISMPYKKETYKCFIEAFPGYMDTDDILGILYFKEEFGEENMVEVKKFYRMHVMGELGPKFEEINFKIYNDLKTKWMEKEEKKDE
jgi:hypothetical protein